VTGRSSIVHNPDEECVQYPADTELVTTTDLCPSASVCNLCDPTVAVGGGEAGCSTSIADIRVCDYGSCLNEGPLRVEVRGKERAVCAEHYKQGHTVLGVTGDRKRIDTELWVRCQYLEHRRSTREIGEICDVRPETVCRRLDKYDIPTRPARTIRSTGPHNSRKWLYRQYVEYERTQREIADVCGVSLTTVRSRMDEYGIPTRPAARRGAKGPHNDAEWLREQYVERGRMLHDIADECGVAESTIRRRMDKYDIPTRPGGRQRIKGPHNDAEWLREQYIERGRTRHDIADECGVSEVSIRRRMDEFGIEWRVGADSQEAGE
jgi:hypothetical protein